METTNVLIESIQNSISLSKIEMEDKVTKLQQNASIYESFLAKLQSYIPSLVATLEKQNLVIDRLSYHKTGIGPDWEENHCLNVCVTANPANSKFKFIKFAGYTKTGAGKNHDALVNRADKLVEAIKAGTGIEGVQANLYSFEYRDNGANNILIDLWLK